MFGVVGNEPAIASTNLNQIATFLNFRLSAISYNHPSGVSVVFWENVKASKIKNSKTVPDNMDRYCKIITKRDKRNVVNCRTATLWLRICKEP